MPARRTLLAALAAGMAAPRAAFASPQGFPVEATIAKPPQPVLQEGRLRLVYELRLTNFSRNAAIEVTRLEVLAPGGPPLASLAGADLEACLGPIGALEDSKRPRLIGQGRTLVAFLNVALATGAAPPTRLRHRLSLAAQGRTQRLEDTIEGLDTPVVAAPAPLLSPPLRGSGWLAGNALATIDHRRAYVTVDGRTTLAQRFAIDWVRLDADGRFFRGEGKANSDFVGYGTDLLAVAPGRVVAIRDGIPDNTGLNTQRAVPITLQTVTGNSVLLDLGSGRFALYAHAQPGSLRVKVGDRVAIGQVLALLGNSGNSDGPHLHFHLVDGPSAMDAEGIPYRLDFTELGVAPQAVVDDNGAWRPTPGVAPAVRHGEFPANNAVVRFA
jgi:murein DD-endopeptidase MepM/ murein hydrolase activator NlpD